MEHIEEILTIIISALISGVVAFIVAMVILSPILPETLTYGFSGIIGIVAAIMFFEQVVTSQTD